MIGRHIPILIPLVLLLGAMLTGIVGARRRRAAYYISLTGLACALVLAVLGLQHVITGETIRYHVGGWQPPIGIEYVLDPLAAFMLVVILGVATLVFIHAREPVEAELRGWPSSFFAVALLLLTGFSGIVLTGDLFNLYVFLEISALSGYALIAVGEKPAPVAAFRYLLVGTIGASFFLLGIGFIYVMTGSLNIADLARMLPAVASEPPIVIGLVLMVIGLAVKMALFPLHGWQPDAYTYAPSAGTALLAPISAKVGAYVLIRVLFFLFEPSLVRSALPLADVLGWLSMGGILFGSIMAIAQSELKRMLAYSSVAQIGYIGLGISLANPLGFVGAVLHVLNHAIMKGGLFLVAGNLRVRIGHSTIPQFDDSLRRAMPWTMAAFAVFALSMVGIPPLAGFFSKWYLVLGGLERENGIAVGVILLSSLLNAVYFFRVLERVYLRPLSPAVVQLHTSNPHPSVWAEKEAKPSMLVPTLIMAVALVVLGLLNALIVNELIVRMLPSGL
jgi:multicomponent Na+:H+ antiporter subunit D